MLTILSTPKAFTGLFAVIQRNTIESWTTLEPRPEIILFGRDAGTAEICDELGLRHVPDVATNEQGTPLLSDMFMTGQALAANPVVCWVNADIIFSPTVMRAAQVVTDHPRPAYLVGRRTDIDQLAPLDFFDGWSEQLASVRGGKASARRRTGSTTSCSHADSSSSFRRSQSVGPDTTHG